jgi:cell division protein DivIC
VAKRKLTLIQKKNRKRRRQLLYRRLLTMGLLIGSFIVAASIMYTNRLTKLAEAKENLAAYQKEYDKLLETEEYYRNEISKLENEDYIAKLAREKYFKSEEGEIIFKLPEEKE